MFFRIKWIEKNFLGRIFILVFYKISWINNVVEMGRIYFLWGLEIKEMGVDLYFFFYFVWV